MPIFEYMCKECGNNFEVLVKSGDDNISCPQCKGGEVSKLFSTFAYRTAGSGPSSGPGCSTCSAKNCAQCA